MRAVAPTFAAVVITCVVGLGLAGCVSAKSPETTTAQSSAPGAGSARNSYQEWPTGPYQVVANWPKPLPDTSHSHDGWTWGSFGSVYAETPDRIWVAMRGELPLPEGAKPWTPYAALDAVARQRPTEHRRPERHLRAAGEARMGTALRARDLRRRRQRQAGRRVAAARQAVRSAAVRTRAAHDQDEPVRSREARLGDRRPAARHLPLHLRRQAGEDVRPARCARTRAEHVRSADRHRVAAGRHLLHQRRLRRQARREVRREGQLPHGLGTAPKDPQNPGPSEFNTPHSIAISEDRRVFVVDRGHQRMQVFDENGKFLDMWPLRSPHWPANQGTLMVNHIITDRSVHLGGRRADQPADQVRSRTATISIAGARPGPQAGRLNCSHGISTDQDGNLFLADCFAGRVQKFAPLPNADRSQAGRPDPAISGQELNRGAGCQAPGTSRGFQDNRGTRRARRNIFCSARSACSAVSCATCIREQLADRR